jgi:hypothetical protein
LRGGRSSKLGSGIGDCLHQGADVRLRVWDVGAIGLDMAGLSLSIRAVCLYVPLRGRVTDFGVSGMLKAVEKVPKNSPCSRSICA